MQTFSFEGLTFEVDFHDADEHMLPCVKNEGVWEPWQLDIYRHIIGPEWNCVDCGANVGLNSLVMSRYASAGWVYSFEPVSETRSILARNLARNNARNVAVCGDAIASAAGTTTIYGSRRALGRASAEASHSGADDFGDEGGFAFSEHVTTTTLNLWWNSAGRPKVDLLKLDIEGAELAALAGAAEVLAACPDMVLVCEFSVECQLLLDERHALISAQLFTWLSATFRHVMLLNRNGQIHHVDGYAQLRTMLLNGHPVEDLLCCRKIPASLSHKVRTDWTIPGSLMSEVVIGSSEAIHFINRDADGWAFPSADLAGTRCGFIAFTSRHKTLCLRIGEIYVKHAPGGDYEVFVSVDSLTTIVAVSDRHAELAFELKPGLHWGFVETKFELSATEYLGNPADNRRIGAHLTASWV